MGSGVPLVVVCWSSSSDILPKAGLAIVVRCHEAEVLVGPSTTVATFNSFPCACFFSGGRNDWRVTRVEPLPVIGRRLSAVTFLSAAEAARTAGADWTGSQSSSSPEPDGRLLIERYAHARHVQASRTVGAASGERGDVDGGQVGVGEVSELDLAFFAQKRRRYFQAPQKPASPKRVSVENVSDRMMAHGPVRTANQPRGGVSDSGRLQ